MFDEKAESHTIRHREFLSESHVADLLCQSVRTIQKWRVTGYGPPFYKFGRSVRYRRAEMIEWVETRRRAHTSQ